MVGIAAPSLSFCALNKTLRAGSVSVERARKILAEHRDTLFCATTVSEGKKSSFSGSNEIRYRANAPTTQTHPSPTTSELAYIDALEKSLEVSRSEAAVLLRDYLTELKGGAVGDVLEQSGEVESIAPLDAIEDFWGKEKRYAFSCLVAICAGASQNSTHAYYELFTAFLGENERAVKDIILRGAAAAISSYEDGCKGLSTGAFSDVEGWWVMEVLFSYCLHTVLRPEEKETLLQVYLDFSKRRDASKSGPEAHVHRKCLDGKEATALFTASLNLSNGLVLTVIAESEAMEMEHNDHDQIDKRSALARSEDAVRRINVLFSEMAMSQGIEPVVMSFSWATFLGLRQWIGGRNAEERRDTWEKHSIEHMSSAVSRDAFGAMHALITSELKIDELIVGDLYYSFWVDLISFLIAFPPQGFTPSQVENVVELSTNILSQTAQDSWKETAESLWEREGTDADMTGMNSLLRIASGVFPQTFRPLISLLTCLAVSQNSASRAAEYLQGRLISLTECSDSYQESLLVLDHGENSELWEFLGPQVEARLAHTVEKLRGVTRGDEQEVFIQAGEDLSRSAYRPLVRKGSLGFANRSLTVVTWITSWNGLAAVDHILRVLLDLLKDHDANSMYEDTVLNELLLSGMECLRLFDRLCRIGSKGLRDNLLVGNSRIAKVASIVAELADPGDWVKDSWLTKKRREALLTASSSCMSSMTSGSASRARQALEHFCSSKNALPLHAALSSLGANAFPAVAATSRIAALCSRTELLRNDFVKKLSTFSSATQTSLTSGTLEGPRGGADGVYNFLRTVALPLWLTTSVMRDASDEGRALHWLLPACSLQLFSNRPRDVLSDPAISSVLVTVITDAAVATSDSIKENEKTNTLLFPALRAALLACYEALQSRNASLQEALERKSDRDAEEVHGSAHGCSADLTALEKLLIKPDVIQALAVMSSGGSERLRFGNFFSAWADSDFRSFLPEVDSSHYLLLNVTKRDAIAGVVCSWRVWVEDMCARCVSLLFCCLSQLSKGGDIIQVPWPTTERSSLGYWRGGGEWIRRGYAERINGGSIAATELMVAVISCGQRAAARSLMGPRRKKTRGLGVGFSGIREAVGSSDLGHKAEGGNQDPKNSLKLDAPEEGTAGDNGTSEVLSAVVHSLQQNCNSWTARMSELSTAEDGNYGSIPVEMGQIALSIATCVRFLRVGWESHSSRWFQDCWKDLHVWELVASLLRCEAGRSSCKSDLSWILDSKYAFLSGISEEVSRIIGSVSTETVLLKQSVFIDVTTAWKAIASDCLHLFSSEILLRSSESLVDAQQLAGGRGDRNDGKVSLEVFKGEPFAQFASVFTERWMHLLLKVDDQYLDGCSSWSTNGIKPKKRQRIANLASSGEEFLSVEQHTHTLSVLLGRAIGLQEQQAEKSCILNDFRRAGDIRTRFGADYHFDVPAILSVMRAVDVDVESHQDLILHILQLNVELCKKDVQAEVVTAFSAMASAVLFADSFAPSQSLALTYSSPQFGGKLCRYLCRVLVCIVPSISSSGHTVAIVGETAKLVAALSASLSADELEQSALTAVRFTDKPAQAEQECNLSALRQLCVVILRIMACVQSNSTDKNLGRKRLESAQWLLLAASRLVGGSAFRHTSDIRELATTAITTMQCSKAFPPVYSAASVAITAVLENSDDVDINKRFDANCIENLFGAVAALAKLTHERKSNALACRSAANLLLNIAGLKGLTGDQHRNADACILRHLSGGSVLAFLPPARETIPTYEANLEERNPAHLVWCASLRLSGVSMPNEQEAEAPFDEHDLRGVMEFCATNLLRIARDSLDLSGDWPSPAQSNNKLGGAVNSGTTVSKHLTIGRVEEAEAATVCLYRLSVFALPLQEVLPDLLQTTVAELVRFTYQVYRLIRAEPVERWVRPVTQRERDRSQLLRSDRESVALIASSGYAMSPWGASPGKAGGPGTGTPPRRSPSQALRAAIGAGGNRSNRLSQSLLPPSPGMPATPQQSPLTPVQTTYGNSYCSPGSPWGPYGAGIITSTGMHFGEEASRSLLRGLWFALAALRRFSDAMDVLLFKPAMLLSEDNLGLGVLVAIQYHACNEVCRGAEDERRDSLVMIVDNALYLTITHVAAYNEKGLLTQAVRDELWKRIGTVRSRMRKVVPPVPSYSLIHSDELAVFLQQLKGS